MKSETIDLLATALCAAQGELKNARINRQNPHFKNRYADLASVRDAIAPTLAKHGLAITQTMEIGELSGGFSLLTMLIHKSGQWVTSEYPLPLNAKPQELGSALTYARRYSLSSIVGIAADEDDDAEMASKANGASAEKITDEQFASLVDMAESVSADRDKLAKYLKVDALVNLPAYRFEEAMSALESKEGQIMTDIVQGSPEWFAARLGKVTASRVVDVVAKTKTGWGASRANYAAQLIAERLTGKSQDSYTNAAMQWGTETEPLARSAYEFHADKEVAQIGFVDHPNIIMCGASPDGLVGKDGLVEIKCPATATHIDTLLDGSVPGKYITQMQFQMSCTGRQWCDFVSFDPRLPERMRLFIQRVNRDSRIILELETQVAAFLGEIEGKIAALLEKFGAQQEAA